VSLSKVKYTHLPDFGSVPFAIYVRFATQGYGVAEDIMARKATPRRVRIFIFGLCLTEIHQLLMYRIMRS